MCLIAFAWNVHPRWRLLLAGNRDEFHARPSAPLARWDDVPIIGGRDLQAGGTWLG
uniref:NRDE family protein n=1 Tax=Burkholderia sp. L27(2015) TaxID=1641858 RepID=UPI001576FFB4